jgi:hypothetical protein
MAQLKLALPLSSVAATTVNGTRVVGIRRNSKRSGKAVTETLYVRATGAPLPVEERMHTATTDTRATFSAWGRPVRVSAPARSIPLG